MDQTMQTNGEKDVVIRVEKGMANHVRIVETDRGAMMNEITVHVSKKRKMGTMPVLGVVVK